MHITDILTDVIIDCTYFLIIVFGVQRQFIDNLLDIHCQLCFLCGSGVVSKGYGVGSWRRVIGFRQLPVWTGILHGCMLQLPYRLAVPAQRAEEHLHRVD